MPSIQSSSIELGFIIDLIFSSVNFKFCTEISNIEISFSNMDFKLSMITSVLSLPISDSL